MEEIDTKKKLHEIVDRLPAEEIPTAEKVLESLLLYREKYGKRQADERFLTWLDGLPEDDEELSEEGKRRIAEGEKDIAEGRVYPFEEVARELGL
jgi:hypothetical protein